MSAVMKSLHEEHRGIARLLRALDYQVRIFDSGEHPDYDVLEGIAEYFTGFPDECHHPKEDLVYRKLRERAPQVAESVSSIESEHEKIAHQAKAFFDAVHSILLEAEISREAVAQVMKDFIANQRHHMQAEEKHFFPLAEKCLTEADWAELDAKVADHRDPLFGPEVAENFRSLRDNLLAWEKEFEEMQEG
jgi:hemerythrin-like domain-containing protein